MNKVRLELLAGCVLVNIPFTAGHGTIPPFTNATSSLPTNGNGTLDASACASAHWSYTSASSAWSRDHLYTSVDTYTNNGSTIEVNTYFESATTLCDGKARVSASPAVPLSTKTTTSWTGTSHTWVASYTQWDAYTGSWPSCSIKPSDCDVLWQDYDRSAAAAPQITPAPQTPPCWNSSYASHEASLQSSLSGCGKCTVFGQGVQLLYFPVPTTVSRDMCATTPSANLTRYGQDVVITAYAGTAYSGMNGPIAGQKTAVVNGHTFTSGTAYISIASVWAEDRCFSRYGTTVSNAILAMPSESVLSLRYTQDHFQYFYDISTQTGYPISYADFNEPVPYSAWNGQNTCRAADDGWSCQVIYQGMYRPQLAMPPGIKDLSPNFADCLQWYNGLYDPPLALTEASSEAVPTVPAHQHMSSKARPSYPPLALTEASSEAAPIHQQVSSTAMPSSTAMAPTSAPTAGGVASSDRGHGGDQAQSEVLDPTLDSQPTLHPDKSAKQEPHPDSKPKPDQSNGQESPAGNVETSTHQPTPAHDESNNTADWNDANAPESDSAGASKPNSIHDESPGAPNEAHMSLDWSMEVHQSHSTEGQEGTHANVGAYIHSGVASWPESTLSAEVHGSSEPATAATNAQLPGFSTDEHQNGATASPVLGDLDEDGSSGFEADSEALDSESDYKVPLKTMPDQDVSYRTSASLHSSDQQMLESSRMNTVYDLSLSRSLKASSTHIHQATEIAATSSAATKTIDEEIITASSSSNSVSTTAATLADNTKASISPSSMNTTGISSSTSKPAMGLVLGLLSLGVTFFYGHELST